MASYTSYSPYSSAGNVESVSGTPDTRLTAFSPDDPRIHRSASHNNSPGAQLVEGQHDPFVTASQSKTDPRLSATASTFKPINRVGPTDGAPPMPGTAQYLNQIIAESTPSRIVEADATKFGTFTTDTGASRSIQFSEIYGKMVMPAVQASLDNLYKTYTMKGSIRFENIGNVSYMRMANIIDASAVYNAVKKDHLDLAVEYISPAKFGQIVSPGSKHSAHEGQILLSARYPPGELSRKGIEDSLRSLLSVEGPLCAWKRISPPNAEMFQMIAEFADAAMAPRAVNRCAEKANNGTLGALMASVTLYTPDISASRRHTPEATPTRSPADAYSLGESFNRMNLNTPKNQDYMSTMTRGPIDLASLPGAMIMGNHLYSPPSMPPLGHQYLPRMHQSPFSPTTFSPFNSGPLSFSPTGLQHGFDRRFAELSPSYAHSPYYDPNASGSRGYSRLSPDRGYSPRSVMMPHRRRGSQNPAAGQHNQVDPVRINAGIDVRTTVMLRNIPNKVNQAELKEIIDQSSFGRYDFMYLRIDFSNDCNVGYAFINFADPLDIIPFVAARSGEKWVKFRSDKVAEVSYATIQGRDCLIQKFRNSSVMLEPTHYRPKLFFTLSDSNGQAGEEEDFPPSDNASKLKRSCENAEHVGLFAPSAGQHLRDEQRRRRSQYDRGTSLAEREDLDFDDGHPAFQAPGTRYIGNY